MVASGDQFLKTVVRAETIEFFSIVACLNLLHGNNLAVDRVFDYADCPFRVSIRDRLPLWSR